MAVLFFFLMAFFVSMFVEELQHVLIHLSNSVDILCNSKRH